MAHTVDVRPVGQREGWHNIRNIGFFLWRLGSYPLRGVTPRASAAGAHCFHVSPLGAPAPLDGVGDSRQRGGEHAHVAALLGVYRIKRAAKIGQRRAFRRQAMARQASPSAAGGQAFALFTIGLAAAEVAIGIGIIWLVFWAVMNEGTERIEDQRGMFRMRDWVGEKRRKEEEAAEYNRRVSKRVDPAPGPAGKPAASSRSQSS